jgi:hypothetical protein
MKDMVVIACLVIVFLCAALGMATDTETVMIPIGLVISVALFMGAEKEAG